MASSNRHWPSMFKSKPNYTTHQDHQWQSHGSHHLSNHRSSPYTSGCNERTPEPKPRWNPKPEQIKILESIFNSGLVNPPRDEIRRIRARLQEYGQVSDANVFYWFQNRKSRSKHKNRHLPKSQNHQPKPPYGAAMMSATTISSSSSSTSSSKSSRFFSNTPTVLVDRQPELRVDEGEGKESSLYQHQHHGEFFQESFCLPVMQQKPTHAPTGACFTQGFCFPELGNMIDQEFLIQTKNFRLKEVEKENVIKMLTHNTPPPPSPQWMPLAAPNQDVPSTLSDLQGVEAGTRKLIVFINDVPYEVDVGPFNVKEAFGEDAVLIDSSGQNVITDEWGVTLESLLQGAFYYVVCAFADDHARTAVDMI